MLKIKYLRHKYLSADYQFQVFIPTNLGKFTLYKTYIFLNITKTYKLGKHLSLEFRKYEIFNNGIFCMKIAIIPQVY